MSGSNYTIVCPKCKATNEPRGKSMTLALTCKSCNTYFRTGSWNTSVTTFDQEVSQAIPLGSKGRIDGHLYEIIGFVVKQEIKYRYYWREYLVFNPYRGYAFLAEYNGHWNFIWPIESDPRKNGVDTQFDYANHTFNLYQKYSASVVYAKGEFFFDIVDLTSSTINYEYIAPPMMLALEQSEDSVLWCKGEYFSPQQIAETFGIPVNKLPSKKGFGYTEPLKANFSDNALVTFTALVLLFTFLIHLIINNMADDKVVFRADYDKDNLKDQKMLVSPSFTLEGSSKNIEVYLSAPLSNDWFFSEFSLINENDGTEYNFTKELEYYSGYEDGESWSEGSQNGEAILSSIPAGKYHINIYPEFNFSNSFSLLVKRDVSISSNFFTTCIGLLIFPLFYFLRKHHREKKRWEESDYSPYETE